VWQGRYLATCSGWAAALCQNETNNILIKFEFTQTGRTVDALFQHGGPVFPVVRTQVAPDGSLSGSSTIRQSESVGEWTEANTRWRVWFVGMNLTGTVRLELVAPGVGTGILEGTFSCFSRGLPQRSPC
jgi:hypothetical protein